MFDAAHVALLLILGSVREINCQGASPAPCPCQETFSQRHGRLVIIGFLALCTIILLIILVLMIYNCCRGASRTGSGEEGPPDKKAVNSSV